MWLLGLAALAAIVFYMYSIRNSIKIAQKPSCGSCPHKINEDEKEKFD